MEADWENEEIPALNLEERPKDKWDDEDVKDEPAPAPAVKPSEKAPKKSSEKKGKKVEKLQEQRLVEEADYNKSTKELFGLKGVEENDLIENFVPKTQSDFLEYAELISHKIRPFECSYHYMDLLKSITRLSLTSLKGADIKEIASSINAIANEKLRAEKEATSKKKKGAKKKQIRVDKPYDDFVADSYDALDDYDFI